MTEETLPELRRTRSPFEGQDDGRAHKLAALKAAVLGTPGPSLAGYRDLRPIGEGGMGVVYRGIDAAAGAPVALKLLRGRDAKGASRFGREIETLQALRHAHVVRYLGHGVTDDDRHYLVMEWLEGCDAAAWAARRVLTADDVVRLGLAAASGLGHAHGQGVVHRDVKPSNLLLVDEDPSRTKVIDFGVAKLLSAADSLTSTGAFLGTPAYMAPEQLEGEASVQADVYGLGATLYRLATGRLPIEGTSASSLLLDVLRRVPPHASEVRSDLPRSLGALLAAMLAKDPAHRPVDMATVALELEDLRRTLGRRGVQVRPSLPVTVDPRAATQQPRLRPLPFVGRAAEVGRALGLAEACFEEGGAGWVLVEGPAGRGKSAVWHRCIDVLRARDVSVADASIDVGVGLPPFALVERVCVAMVDAGWIESDRGRTLGELVAAMREGVQAAGLPVGARLDALREAWAALLDTLDGSVPRVLAVDALDRADGPSMRFLRQLLAHARDAPFVLLATATDGARVASAFDGEQGLAHDRVTLPPIRTRALHRALREAGLDDADTRTRWIARCEGSVARLQAAAQGSDAPPDTQASDFDGLVLQALAVQQPSWRPLVAALVGLQPESPVLGAALRRAVERGELRQHPGGRFEHHPELWLRAAPSSEGDAEAHRVCADWMDAVGEFPAETRIPHYRACGDRVRCSAAALGAAATALEVDDIGALETLLRDVDADVLGEDARGQWSRLVFAWHMARNRIEQAITALDDAMARTPEGSAGWYALFADRVTALGQQGRNDEVRASWARLGRPPEGSDATREGWVVASARVASQVAAWDPHGFHRMVDDIEPVVQRGRVSPQVRGVFARLRGVYDARLGIVPRLGLLDEAHHAFSLAGDRRSAAMTRMFWGLGQLRVGGWRHARAAIDDVLEVAERLGADYMHGWARYARARLLVELDPQAALPELESVRRYFDSSPRIASGAWVYEGWARLRLGEGQAAVQAARQAAECHDAVEIRACAAAVVVLAATRGVAVGSLDDALAAIRAGREAPQLLEFGAHVRFAEAEHARVQGRADARQQLAETRDRLLGDLGPFEDAAQQSAALHGPWLHRAIMQAADAMQLPPAMT